MRMMAKAKPFMDVPAECSPEGWEGKNPPPVFSEVFLYETVGKGDARFILGVVQEYAHVIEALGPKAVTRLLAVSPRLVQRLGTGEKLSEWLEDAVDDEQLLREQRHPNQVILDDEAAHEVWEILHGEYKRYFDPETDMPREALRAYHTLTDGLGSWEQEQRQKEIDRLPERLAQKEERKAKVAARREARRNVATAVEHALRENGIAEDQAMALSSVVERAVRPFSTETQ